MDRKLFVFDVGGVVIYDTKVLVEFCRKYNLCPDCLMNDWKGIAKPLHEGLIVASDLYRLIENKYGIDLSSDPFMVTCYHPRINQSIRDAILRLQAAGHRVVAGSNTIAEHWELLKAMDPNPIGIFNALYASHEIHLCKPEPAFFKYIIEHEGFDPMDSIMVDDAKENIIGARSVGMTVFNYLLNDGDFSAFLKPYLD